MDTLLYNFSCKTFPINKALTQYSANISSDDAFSECVLLAEEILGVECYDTVYNTGFQITPNPAGAKTIKECRECHAFNHYFSENFGKYKGHCYFDSEYEAFYNLIKAWKIWKKILEDEEKLKYFSEAYTSTNL